MTESLEEKFPEPTRENIKIGDVIFNLFSSYSLGPLIQFEFYGRVIEVKAENNDPKTISLVTHKNDYTPTRKNYQYSNILVLKKDGTYLIGRRLKDILNNSLSKDSEIPFLKLEQTPQTPVQTSPKKTLCLPGFDPHFYDDYEPGNR